MNTPAQPDKMNPANYYRMPPVGYTVTRARIGKEIRLMHTLRCGSKNCWFVGNAGNETDAQQLMDDHKCPTPPQRNELPTGASTLEKMWDELDDVTKAVIEGGEYNGMQGASLKAYALGCAFALSMMTHPYFRTVKEISKELGQRYKMSTGAIPFRETPSYRYNPMPGPEPLTANVVSNRPMEQRVKPAKKSAPSVARVKRVMISPEQQTQIKAGLGAGIFSHEDLATMYKVPVESIRAIAASMG